MEHRRRTEPANSSLQDRSKVISYSEKQNQPLTLPRLNQLHQKKPDRNTMVLNEFVHKYFRRKSQSSCLQLVAHNLQQQTTSMHTQPEQIPKGEAKKELNQHVLQQRQKRYRNQRKSHLRSLNDGMLLQHPQQMLVSRTRIDQYFYLE